MYSTPGPLLRIYTSAPLIPMPSLRVSKSLTLCCRGGKGRSERWSHHSEPSVLTAAELRFEPSIVWLQNLLLWARSQDLPRRSMDSQAISAHKKEQFNWFHYLAAATWEDKKQQRNFQEFWQLFALCFFFFLRSEAKSMESIKVNNLLTRLKRN